MFNVKNILLSQDKFGLQAYSLRISVCSQRSSKSAISASKETKMTETFSQSIFMLLRIDSSIAGLDLGKQESKRIDE